MEFTFDVSQVLPGKITVLETTNESNIKIYSLYVRSAEIEKQASNSSWIYHSTANTPWDIRLKKKKEDLVTIVNEMGFSSAQAQSLRSPITTLKKLLNSTNQKVYIISDVENNKIVIGFLKIGIKRLFVCDDVGAHHEVDPLCILDFYVHESKQRCGFGHELFDIMLQAEKVMPEKLAIDRPSYKFLAFLNKHYNLKNHIVQANNFVIYPGFFNGREAMQPVKSNSNKKQYSHSGSYKNEAEALSPIKVPLCSNELRKNKTFYSSAARCLVWNEEENVSARNKQFYSPNSSAHSVSTNSSSIKSTGNWHMQTPAQSCSDAHKKMDGWNSNHSAHCSLPPVNNVPNYSRRKWDELQSSWNIFGVKPVDYSVYQKQN